MSDEFYSSEAVLAPVPASYHVSAFEELMRSEDYLKCYMLEYGGETVGYALLDITYCREAGGKEIWIEELYVRENFRDKGIGHAFFDFIGREENCKRFRLETEKDNLRARKLYASVGYKELPYLQLIKDV